MNTISYAGHWRNVGATDIGVERASMNYGGEKKQGGGGEGAKNSGFLKLGCIRDQGRNRCTREERGNQGADS